MRGGPSSEKEEVSIGLWKDAREASTPVHPFLRMALAGVEKGFGCSAVLWSG